MKLMKVAVLGLAMIALCACDNKCEHDCQCKAPDTISQKTAYNLFKDTYTDMFNNSVFECERKSFDKDENDNKGPLYASDNFSAQIDEDFMEFTCSDKPDVLSFLCDRTNNNNIYSYDSGEWQDVAYTIKFPEDAGSTTANDVGLCFTECTKEYRRIVNGLLDKDSLINYHCTEYTSTFEYLNDTVTVECAYGNGGLTIRRITISQFTGVVYIDLSLNFLSFGSAAPTHLE